ncbi:MAG: protein-L-isoaspartate(D-aspartate) O-methyltransferase [Chloroflexota bacterium]
MVREQLEARGIRDAAVLAAMASVPRERFVPPALRRDAYDDGALAIGHGQTISQPWIVARMTEALQLRAWSAAHPGRPPRVLDVGTGSGYQAAVLAAMGASVVSIERDAELSRRAAATLGGLGVRLELVVGDGSLGHPPRAPYAAIVVAAAAPDVPRPLVEQLEDGGRLVLPIGPRSRQELTVVTREGDHVVRRELDPAVFVPLLGRYGQDSDPDA